MRRHPGWLVMNLLQQQHAITLHLAFLDVAAGRATLAAQRRTTPPVERPSGQGKVGEEDER